MKLFLLCDMPIYEGGTIFGVFDENHLEDAKQIINNSMFKYDIEQVEIEINKFIDEIK